MPSATTERTRTPSPPRTPTMTARSPLLPPAVGAGRKLHGENSQVGSERPKPVRRRRRCATPPLEPSTSKGGGCKGDFAKFIAEEDDFLAWPNHDWTKQAFQPCEDVFQLDDFPHEQRPDPVTPRPTGSSWKEVNQRFINLAPSLHSCFSFDGPCQDELPLPMTPACWSGLIEEDVEEAVSQNSVEQLVLAFAHARRFSVGHAIFEAIHKQHLPALRMLVESGVEGVDEPFQGHRPIHAAVKLCLGVGDVAYEMTELLLKHGASPDACPTDGPDVQPPLLNAVHRGCVGIAELLLSYGADPNVTRAGGNTLLHMACSSPFSVEGDGPMLWKGATSMVNLLLRYKADPGTVNAMGYKPSQYSWDPVVQATLWKAERRWERQSLANVLARFGFDRESPSERVTCAPLWRPEIARLVIECL